MHIAARNASNPFEVPRAIFLIRLLWLCFFPVFAAVTATFVLIFVPQAREVIGLMRDAIEDNGSGWYPHFFWFCVAYLYLAFTTWFTARMLLGRRYPRDLVGMCASEPFAAAAVKQIPRILAVLSTLPVAAYFLGAIHFGYGAVLLALTAAFLLFVVYRRTVSYGVLIGAAVGFAIEWLLGFLEFDGTWAAGLLILGLVLLAVGMRFRRSWILGDGADTLFEGAAETDRRPGEQYVHFDRLTCTGRSVLVALFILSFGLALLLWCFNISLPRTLGSATILLATLASWTLFGGIVLTYLPKAVLGWPSLTWVPAVLFVAFAPFNDNHVVGQRDPVPVAAATSPRPSLEQHFAAWVEALDGADYPQDAPLYVVAVAGGASRAAVWSSVVLGELEHEARRSGRPFGRAIYTISGISGGSLGAAAYVTALAEHPYRATAPDKTDCVLAHAVGFTGQDHAAPLLARMFFADLPQRLLPFPIARADRSLGLEETWEQDWRFTRPRGCRESTTQPSDARPNPWERPLSDLYRPVAGSTPCTHELSQRCDLPSLMLNTAVVESGGRALQSNVTVPSESAVDLLSGSLDVSGLRLSGAVHNSARFPYVSPPGTVRRNAVKPKDRDDWGHVVDGGYFEASGAESLAEVLEQLVREKRLRRDAGGLVLAIDKNPKDLTSVDTRARDVVVVLIDNAPTADADWLCPDGKSGEMTVPADAGSPGQAPALIEPFGPPAGLLNARTGRGRAAEVRLRDMAGGCAGEHFVELRFPRTLAHAQPSMTWGLNRTSIRQMCGAVTPGRSSRSISDRYLLHHLDHLRALLRINPRAKPERTCAFLEPAA